MKNKKIIIATIVSLLLVGIITIIFVNLKGDKQENYKTRKLYEKLKNMDEYTFITKLDKENISQYSQKGDKAYMIVKNDGRLSEYIMKDGNTYLIQRENDRYFTYENDYRDFKKVEKNLEYLVNKTPNMYKEELNDQKYDVEEFEEENGLAFMDTSEGEIKTKLYYKKDELKYIKTVDVKNNTEEILEVVLEDKVEDSLLEIPKGLESK